MKSWRPLLASLAASAVLSLGASAAEALQVKVSVNFGPTIAGPDNGTLVVAANPGDILLITWALGTDTDIDRYRGLVGGVDTTEMNRFGGSALELTGQGFDPAGNPNAPFPGEFGYFAWSDGAPIGFAGNGGELWRIEYVVTAPASDPAADMTYTFQPGECLTFFAGVCPGTSGTEAVNASLRLNVVPEPASLLWLALAAGFGLARRQVRT